MKRTLKILATFAIAFGVALGGVSLAYVVQGGDTPYSLWGDRWEEEIVQCDVTDPTKLPVGCEVEEILGARTAAGGGGSVATLSDVTLTGLADNEILTYDDASGKWINEANAGAGASTALDNLASVAINTSLISDTANTDDLGSAAIPWRSLYVTSSVWLGSTTTITKTDNGAIGSELVLYQNSASPSGMGGDEDQMGRILFRGNDDVGNPADYLILSSKALLISSTTPLAALSLSTNDGAGSTIETHLIYYDTATVNYHTAGSLDASFSAPSGAADFSGATEVTITSGADIDLKPGGSSLLYLDDGGMVGINTTTPDAALHMVGSKTKLEFLDDGGTSGNLNLFHNSASPSAFDVNGAITVSGNNDAAEETVFSLLGTGAASVTDGAEQTFVFLNMMEGGSSPTGQDTHWFVQPNNFSMTTFNDTENGYGLTFKHDSASPATDDKVGTIQFQGNDSGDNMGLYASIDAKIVTSTDGAEQGMLQFMVAGGATNDYVATLFGSTMTSTMRIGVENNTGACLAMEDSDGGGVTYLTFLDGNIVTSTVSCE